MADCSRPACQGVWRGQALVEFALVVVLFLGTLMAMFEGTRLVTSYVALSNAAQESARAGLYVPTSQLSLVEIDADIRDSVRRTAPFLDIPDGSITICRRATPSAACGTTPIQSGSVVEVTVAHSFHFVPAAGGWLGQQSIPLTGYHRVAID